METITAVGGASAPVASPAAAGRPAPQGQAPPAPVALVRPFSGPRTSPRPADPEQVREAVKTLNDSLIKPPLEARYSIDDDSRQIVIKIVNQSSGEVLRQIPNEAAVQMARVVAQRPPAAAPATLPNLLDEKA